ncbi:MAG: endonuclease/exonuclease/phosphatase family protein, partial [Lysobacteraceae bacterium]
AGRWGGLPAGALFDSAGDRNNQPVHGDGRHAAILGLLRHPRVLQAPAPRSAGAAEAALLTGQGNVGQRGDPAEDTGDFGPKVGDLRLDYVLPSVGFRNVASGVEWPTADDPHAVAAKASDHHPVWVDLEDVPPSR